MTPLRSFFNHFYDTSFVICPRAFASWSSRPHSHIWPWCVPSCSPLAHCGNTRPSTATPWVNHGESVMSGASLPLRCGNMIRTTKIDSMSAFWTMDRTFCKSGHAAIAWAEVASTRTKMVAQEPKYCQYRTRLVKCISLPYSHTASSAPAQTKSAMM